MQSSLNQAQLAKERQQLFGALKQFKNTIGSALRVQQWEEVSQAMLDLHTCGRLLLLHLFDDDGKKLSRAIDLCQRACPTWNQVGWENDVLPPCMVVFDSAIEDSIPVELLPLFNFKKPAQFCDFGGFGSVAQSFMGFSTIIKRVIRGTSLPSVRYLENTPQLPVKFFWYESLPGAAAEFEFFQNNQQYFSLDGPWPDNNAHLDSKNFTEVFASHIWRPTVGFAGGKRYPPDQVLHFACHCHASTPSPADYSIHLEWIRWWSRQYGVTYKELEDNFGQLQLFSPVNTKFRPLVFLNACESSMLDPAGFGSFPKLFLRFGYLGFIGPETAIPDRFAAAFSERLYRQLLQGRTLGEAMYIVRWKMMKECKNPLGILYSLYADPEISVRKPVEGAVV